MDYTENVIMETSSLKIASHLDLNLNRRSDNSGAHPSAQERPEAEEGDWHSPWGAPGGNTPLTHPTPRYQVVFSHLTALGKFFLSQELKEHGYWYLQNLCDLPWGWNTGIVVHSPEQLQQKQQRLGWTWPLNHMEIMGTSASQCKRTSCTALIFTLKHF